MHKITHSRPDPLNAARGIMSGLILAVPMWIAFVLILKFLLSEPTD